MLFFAVALYFVLACLISWMLLFPTGRAFVIQTLSGAGARIQRHWQSMTQRRTLRVASINQSGRALVGEARNFLRQHYVICIIGAILLALPPLAAILSGAHTRLSGFQDSTREVNGQVAALLEGEHLAPPPPLPPVAFTTAEVRQERPLIASASRDWGMLRPEFEQRLLLAFRIMKEQHGYDMTLLEGYRGPERQQLLAAMGPNVTNAAAFQSWHQYGLAADSAFVRDGRIVISEKDPWAMRGYQLYGQVAESVGLTWGGRWKLMDLGHTELRVPGVMKRK
ncbi:peptidase M15 [Massilia sp. KIM]|uniref:M15 family metallopeptidase n=1 Tax=Massilia sp. KIM TaxID=1955422 RepID=UPI00099029CC|nr:M15 family metallopeptidase [Massilia sp. KIM]OON62806.1 peptidase M15 [Massilia sp. KIM]